MVCARSLDWSVPGESIRCQPAACLWVPPHWFFLMVDVSEYSFEGMLANWISSPFVGCCCKWMLIDSSTAEAEMTDPLLSHIHDINWDVPATSLREQTIRANNNYYCYYYHHKSPHSAEWLHGDLPWTPLDHAAPPNLFNKCSDFTYLSLSSQRHCPSINNYGAKLSTWIMCLIKFFSNHWLWICPCPWTPWRHWFTCEERREASLSTAL